MNLNTLLRLSPALTDAEIHTKARGLTRQDMPQPAVKRFFRERGLWWRGRDNAMMGKLEDAYNNPAIAPQVKAGLDQLYSVVFDESSPYLHTSENAISAESVWNITQAVKALGHIDQPLIDEFYQELGGGLQSPNLTEVDVANERAEIVRQDAIAQLQNSINDAVALAVRRLDSGGTSLAALKATIQTLIT